MEKIANYLITHFNVVHDIAPIAAFIVAVLENKSRGIKDCIIVSLIAVGIAGAVENYIPLHTVFISLLIGVLSGVCTDDLYTKLLIKFPTFVDDVLEIIFGGIKAFFNKLFGDNK